MKLHGFEFWDNIGRPKYVLAPMVEHSELAWRLLSRKYGAQLTYTPMINSSIILTDETYRKKMMQMHKSDWPLIVQFCGNDPHTLLKAAKIVEPFCEAVDLNLGCPQNIAKRGHYGAFLEEWDLIHKIVNTLHTGLETIPVTVKFRVFDSTESSCEFAKMLVKAGASVLAVHGRTREQKGPLTGLADWQKIAEIKVSLRTLHEEMQIFEGVASTLDQETMYML